jgi:hypothetical protein
MKAPASNGTFIFTPSTGAFSTSLISTATANRVLTLPDKDGTVALVSDLDTRIPYHGVFFDNSNYEISLSYNSTNRTLSITPSGASYRVWIKGTLYTFTGTQTIQHTDTEGAWYLYYNASGVLVA